MYCIIYDKKTLPGNILNTKKGNFQNFDIEHDNIKKLFATTYIKGEGCFHNLYSIQTDQTDSKKYFGVVLDTKKVSFLDLIKYRVDNNKPADKLKKFSSFAQHIDTIINVHSVVKKTRRIFKPKIIKLSEDDKALFLEFIYGKDTVNFKNLKMSQEYNKSIVKFEHNPQIVIPSKINTALNNMYLPILNENAWFYVLKLPDIKIKGGNNGIVSAPINFFYKCKITGNEREELNLKFCPFPIDIYIAYPIQTESVVKYESLMTQLKNSYKNPYFKNGIDENWILIEEEELNKKIIELIKS